MALFCNTWCFSKWWFLLLHLYFSYKNYLFFLLCVLTFLHKLWVKLTCLAKALDKLCGNGIILYVTNVFSKYFGKVWIGMRATRTKIQFITENIKNMKQWGIWKWIMSHIKVHILNMNGKSWKDIRQTNFFW